MNLLEIFQEIVQFIVSKIISTISLLLIGSFYGIEDWHKF